MRGLDFAKARHNRCTSEVITLGSALASMTQTFAAAGLETPALDARRLIAAALGADPILLLRNPDRLLSEDDCRRLIEFSARRLAREPVSRIEGRRAFHGLDLEIGPSTLDPRPDTETLVEAIVSLAGPPAVPKIPEPKILDLGTGSGAILIALLDKLPGATGLGVDIDESAVQIASRNATRHGLSNRARFQVSNWLDQIVDRFDIIVSNPPYIRSGKIAGLDPEVARYDPLPALDGGPDGLDAYRSIARRIADVLAPGGWVAVEVGIGQCEAALDILTTALSPDSALVECRTWRDLGGIIRCVAVRSRV